MIAKRTPGARADHEAGRQDLFAVNIRNAAPGAGETSSRLLASAKALSSESFHLKAEVEKFLDGVRAA